MATKLGGLTIADLLTNRFQSAAAFGLSTIAEVIANDLQAHNRNTAEIMSAWAATSADRQRIYGGSDVGEMQPANEYSRPDTQRVGQGITVGFPLRLYQYGIGWTTRWFQRKTVAEVAEQYDNSKKAHLITLRKELQKAIFGATNYTFFDDLVSPQINLAVKRLVNADSSVIPDGPNGETFNPATHTHYLASATLTAAAFQSLIDTVVEHGHAQGLMVAVAAANAAAVEALTGFTKPTPITLVQGLPTTTAATVQRVDLNQPRAFSNRFLGMFGAAEVWVKPWAIANYAVCWAQADPNKPLVLRTPAGAGPDLMVAAELEAYPMHAQYMETEFGVGAWTRTNGAVLQFSNATYQVPTI
jgi:hypothetical protein